MPPTSFSVVSTGTGAAGSRHCLHLHWSVPDTRLRRLAAGTWGPRPSSARRPPPSPWSRPRPRGPRRPSPPPPSPRLPPLPRRPPLEVHIAVMAAPRLYIVVVTAARWAARPALLLDAAVGCWRAAAGTLEFHLAAAAPGSHLQAAAAFHLAAGAPGCHLRAAADFHFRAAGPPDLHAARQIQARRRWTGAGSSRGSHFPRRRRPRCQGAALRAARRDRRHPGHSLASPGTVSAPSSCASVSAAAG
mmetsp:Transcript_73919/g.208678  ORF Transcript_73919/g.208678 Transcript_73919/m.208678 type:complete len:246 (+) Transcript_73919:314-1051(+)